MVTQDKSKVLKETENPFEDDDDDEPTPAAAAHSRQSSVAQSSKASTPSFIAKPTVTSPVNTKKSKKDKDKKSKKAKAFNFEAEKGIMKNCIAESSVAATNLLNALRLINREQEQISENKNAVTHFEACKQLRRKILRYVCSHTHKLTAFIESISDSTCTRRRMARSLASC